MVAGESAATFAMIFFGFSGFVFIMLLPALLELKKPKDAGPRMIFGKDESSQILARIHALEKNDEVILLDQMQLKSLLRILAALPNLET